MLEKVFESIDSNTTFDANIKEKIKGLVIIFNKFFPNISLENFSERIKTLKIERQSKFVSKRIFNYNPMSNVLSFNALKLSEDYDSDHIMMSAILVIITSHDDTYGFDKENKLIAFNTGYTEILSNFLVGNEKELTLYDEEVTATNLIAEVIGNDVLFEAYFTNNFDLVMNSIVKVSE